MTAEIYNLFLHNLWIGLLYIGGLIGIPILGAWLVIKVLDPFVPGDNWHDLVGPFVALFLSIVVFCTIMAWSQSHMWNNP